MDVDEECQYGSEEGEGEGQREDCKSAYDAMDMKDVGCLQRCWLDAGDKDDEGGVMKLLPSDFAWDWDSLNGIKHSIGGLLPSCLLLHTQALSLKPQRAAGNESSRSSSIEYLSINESSTI